MWACPVAVGQRIEAELALDTESIIAGAIMMRDLNPLHNDAAEASKSRFGSLIACGPHVAGIHACMLPTYFTGRRLGVVGIEFTVQYRRPVLPDAVYTMWWEVANVEVRGSNWRTDWIGAIEAAGSPSIAGTGSVLVLGPPAD